MLQLLALLISLCLFSALASAQGIITTIVGRDWVFTGDGGSALNAPLGSPRGVVADRNGNVYIADASNRMIFRVAPNGVLTVYAGTGASGSSGDGGPARNAAVGSPVALAIDAAGVLYLTDGGLVRRISIDGTISTVAGGGTTLGDGGPATSAQLNLPQGLALDRDGTLYISEVIGHRVRRVTPAGMISTFAGTGVAGFSGDNGPATAAQLSQPFGIALDNAGGLLICDGGNGRLRRVLANGTIATIAGTVPAAAGSGDGGPATRASFSGLTGVAVNPAGEILTVENSVIRVISSAGIISRFAGTSVGFSGDGGPALQARLLFPFAAALDAAGALYIGDLGSRRVRKVDGQGIITTIAGNFQYKANPERSLAIAAFLESPSDLALDSAGNLHVADTQLSRVRVITPSGLISTVAGNGECCFSGDGGLATQAQVRQPLGVAVDRLGNVYTTQQSFGYLRKITPDGLISTLAGTAAAGFQGDGGPANLAQFSAQPISVALDSFGNTYVADFGNARVRRIDQQGLIRTIAGNGQQTSSGDGGQAALAAIGLPSALAVDANNNLYIADVASQRVRRVTPDGIISTVAGNGTAGFAGDGGPATAARLNFPGGLAIDRAGNLYIADTNNNRIRMVNAGGTITTVAGSDQGFSGDGGPATSARLSIPGGVAVDDFGNLYISDTGNHRIRMVQPVSTPSACGFAISTRTANFSARGGNGSLLVTANPTCAWQASGAPSWITIVAGANGTGQGSVVYSVAANSDTSPRAALLTIAGERFTVRQAAAPPLAIEPDGFTLAFSLGSAATARTISVAVAGQGSLVFTATAQTSSGGNWLSVTPASGTASAAAPASLLVAINPRPLGAGSYSGQITIIAGATAEQVTIPVAITVSNRQQSLVLSQTGLTFRTVAGSGALPPQAVSIVNGGAGNMPWTVETSTISGGSAWLSATPASGSSTGGGTAPTLSVQVNATGLATGDYYGQVRVTAPGAGGSPQAIAIVLNVVAADAQARAFVDPSGFVFLAAPGGANPAAQSIQISNVTRRALTFSTSVAFTPANQWFTLQPAGGSIAAGAAARVDIQPNITGLAEGVYRAALTIRFAEDNSTTVLDLLLVVSGGTLSPARQARADAGCEARRLLPVFLSPGGNFSSPAGWPVPIRVRVVDDCGQPMSDGVVSASFSNNEPQLALASIGSGLWSATWPARTAGLAQVTITVRAVRLAPSMEGRVQVGGGVETNPNPPVVADGGVLNAASFRLRAPVSPGSLVSIFGTRLSERLQEADKLPLEIELAGTLASIAGRPLPLVFTSNGQVNAMIPYDLEANTTHQLIVRRTTSLSVPEPVIVSNAQPAIFSVDGTGRGQGHIYRATAEGTQVRADAASPATAGDFLVIYATGLGAVDPPIRAGDATPFSPLSQTTQPVSVTIGGVPATILFAGPTPAFTGLYQINLIVPAGVPPGSEVPIVVTVADQPGAPATLAVR